MEQYISKSALVAEIDRELESISNASTNFALGRKMELANILSFLDTLEVKEVDLDKEIDRWYNKESSKEFENVFYCDIEKFAKHFFELGLNAQKGE